MSNKFDNQSLTEALKTVKLEERQEMINPAASEAADAISVSFDS
ncbi:MULTISPECIES: hypothetical protein [Chryseobacterium]|nr:MULTISPECIES: hypothetical protein [Chryseobacterium]MDR6923945.1 hypothetical protein [Chryseobacterium sp. 2987]MDR6923946.1 hypothetical protein [Chryseobacterium sp. 2987]MDR6923947.1 hypothetical protein [Chryseobacterium sp. 2987]